MLDNGYRVIDAHCHIYPDKIAERAMAGTDGFYGIKNSDCHGTVEDLIKVGLDAGIDGFVVQSVATTPHQVQSINEFIAKSVAESDGLLVGLGTLHPDSQDIAGDIKHLTELGLKGVKLHPDIQRFKIDDYRCLKIYELCENMGLPILMHTGDHRYDYSNPNRLLPVMEIYTDLTVIGAHLGGWSIWDEAAEKLSGLPNLYVDCSSSLYALSPEKARSLIRTYGAKKVLFGTDYPMWEPKAELERFFALGLTPEENNLILYQNTADLLSLQKKVGKENKGLLLSFKERK